MVFVSSRRRHTRYWRDWSSDVCSSDLNDALLCAKHLLSGKYGFMCQYRKIKFETIWSTIFDIVTPNMFLAEGNPEYVEYQERRLLIQNNSNFPHPSGDKALGRI